MNLRNYPEIEMEFDADIAGVAAEIIEKAGGRHNSLRLSCCLTGHLGCMYSSSATNCMHVCCTECLLLHQHPGQVLASHVNKLYAMMSLSCFDQMRCIDCFMLHQDP